jgi:TetR/AcrR family transcriptional regulator, transcriptional repressor of bet genes
MAEARRRSADPAPIERAKYIRLTSEERRTALIQAALICIARGGIQEFTVDKVSAEAGISRGLIAHHFGSINGLLAAVYARAYAASLPDLAGTAGAVARIALLIDTYVDPRFFNRETLNVWLALWGQISVNAELGAEHRRQYAAYLDGVTTAIAALAKERGRTVDSKAVAKALICLADGLGVQHCLDPDVMPASEARALCLAFLAPHLGPIV